MDPCSRPLTPDTEQRRCRALKQALEPLRALLARRRVLIVGSGQAPEIRALLDRGAADLVGVEPASEWVCYEFERLREGGPSDGAEPIRTAAAHSLPFGDAAFGVVVLSGGLEHLPQPRTEYLRDLWRVLSPGGHLIVTLAPNRYRPEGLRTRRPWFVPWLPSSLARSYATVRGRFNRDAERATSGWRGLGYFALVGALDTPYRLVPGRNRVHDRLLCELGLPASILDPYPTWVLEKLGVAAARKTLAQGRLTAALA